MAQHVYDSPRDEPYLGYHGDGLIDIYVGLSIVIFAVMIYAEMPWLAGIFPVLMALQYAQAKRSITAPRLKPEEKTGPGRGRLTLSLLVVVGLVAFVLGLVVFRQTLLDTLPNWALALLTDYSLLTAGVLIALMFALVGALNRITRFYLYGGLSVLLFGALHFLTGSFTLGVLILGVLISLVGGVVLYRFMQRPTA